MSSHAVSGVLHALFLLLAFLTPVTGVLEGTPSWVEDLRITRLEIETDVVIETGFRHTAQTEVLQNWGRGGAPGKGEGDHQGARAGTRVKSDPPNPRRSLRASTQAALVDDVEGLLAGFADQQLGPDTETALGALDDGGGRAHFDVGGFGGFGGGGASCGWYWRTRKDGTVKRVKTKPCKGAQFALGMGGFGRIGLGRDVEPDLGDKNEASVVPTVIAGRPVGCTTAEACPWKEIIGKVIRRHKRELQYCYDNTLERRQELFDAAIDLSFAIAPTGGPASVDLASSSGIPEFDRCVQARVSRWIFPNTGMPIRANYPFRFAVL